MATYVCNGHAPRWFMKRGFRDDDGMCEELSKSIGLFGRAGPIVEPASIFDEDDEDMGEEGDSGSSVYSPHSSDDEDGPISQRLHMSTLSAMFVRQGL
eukprot:4912155-Prymnesium_polylepis.1